MNSERIHRQVDFSGVYYRDYSYDFKYNGVSVYDDTTVVHSSEHAAEGESKEYSDCEFSTIGDVGKRGCTEDYNYKSAAYPLRGTPRKKAVPQSEKENSQKTPIDRCYRTRFWDTMVSTQLLHHDTEDKCKTRGHERPEETMSLSRLYRSGKRFAAKWYKLSTATSVCVGGEDDAKPLPTGTLQMVYRTVVGKFNTEKKMCEEDHHYLELKVLPCSLLENREICSASPEIATTARVMA